MIEVLHYRDSRAERGFRSIGKIIQRREASHRNSIREAATILPTIDPSAEIDEPTSELHRIGRKETERILSPARIDERRDARIVESSFSTVTAHVATFSTGRDRLVIVERLAPLKSESDLLRRITLAVSQ